MEKQTCFVQDCWVGNGENLCFFEACSSSRVGGRGSPIIIFLTFSETDSDAINCQSESSKLTTRLTKSDAYSCMVTSP